MRGTVSSRSVLDSTRHRTLDTVVLRPSLPPRQILVISSSGSTQRLLSRVLTLSNVHYVATTDNRATLGVLSRGPSVKLIVASLHVNRISNLRLVHRMHRSIHTTVPVVVISNSTSIGSTVTTVRLDIISFLLGPVSANGLLRLIGRRLKVRP